MVADRELYFPFTGACLVKRLEWHKKSFIKQASAGSVTIETFTPSFPVIYCGGIP